jgi:hypothetical protein
MEHRALCRAMVTDPGFQKAFPASELIFVIRSGIADEFFLSRRKAKSRLCCGGTHQGACHHLISRSGRNFRTVCNLQ